MKSTTTEPKTHEVTKHVSAHVERTPRGERVRVEGPIAAEIRRQLAWISNARIQEEEGRPGVDFDLELRHAMDEIAKLTLDVEDIEAKLRQVGGAS